MPSRSSAADDLVPAHAQVVEAHARAPARRAAARGRGSLGAQQGLVVARAVAAVQPHLAAEAGELAHEPRPARRVRLRPRAVVGSRCAARTYEVDAKPAARLELGDVLEAPVRIGAAQPVDGRERETRRARRRASREAQVDRPRLGAGSRRRAGPERVQRQGVSMSCVSTTKKRAPPGQTGVGSTPASRIADGDLGDERVDRRLARREARGGRGEAPVLVGS